MIWFQFLLSAAVIVIAGTKLTVYADILSEKLNLGKVWIGVALLGIVTSLPEAAASISSVVFLNAPDLAVGNVLGSNNFNPVLIVVADILYRQGPVTNIVHFNRSHFLSAAFALILTCIVIGEVTLSQGAGLLSLGPISLGSLLIFMIYLGGMQKLSSLETPESRAKMEEQYPNAVHQSLPTIYLILFLSALFVVLGAVWLANSADQIALSTGLGRTFVGTFFLALATSLPEMVVTISALRLGALDLAIGNIFGSNMANMFIILICDLVDPSGPILSGISGTHIVTGILSIVLTVVVLAGFKNKNKNTVAGTGLGWDSLALAVFFLSGTYLIYQLR